MKWYLKVLRQYADFSGRASRKEYWMFVLFNLIFAFAVGIFAAIIGIICYGDSKLGGQVIVSFIYLYYFAIMIPFAAVSVRRLHDAGISGWFVLFIIVPAVLRSFFQYSYNYELQVVMNTLTMICSVVMLVFVLLPGKKEINRFGVHPQKILKYGEKVKINNLANTLIIASSVYFIMKLLPFIVNTSMREYVTIGYLLMQTAWLIPMLIAGILLSQKNRNSQQVGIALIIAAALDIIRIIIYYLSTGNSPYGDMPLSFNINIFLNKLYIIQPLALLLAGIVWMQKDKPKQIVQPKIAAVCLIVVVVFSVLCEMFRALAFVDTYFAYTNISFVMTVALFLLAMQLLPKKEVLPYETLIAGDAEYASQVQQQLQQQAKPVVQQTSLGWKIFGFFVSIFLIIGGFSGEMVLRGTESSTALIVVGFLFLIADVYSIITHKKQEPEEKQENKENQENQ